MNDIRADLVVHKDALVRDASALLADVQTLLQDVAAEANHESAQAREQLAVRLGALQKRLIVQRQAVKGQLSQWANSTDRYVREHPWQSVGSAAAVAAVAGAVAALAVTHR